jgi:hypothetical protein
LEVDGNRHSEGLWFWFGWFWFGWLMLLLLLLSLSSLESEEIVEAAIGGEDVVVLAGVVDDTRFSYESDVLEYNAIDLAPSVIRQRNGDGREMGCGC